jgi:hypothetical protein
MRSKANKGRRQSEQALAPLIKAYAADPAMADKLAEKLSDVTGLRFHRQEVGAWLNADPKKRVEPMMGAGLLLVKHGMEMIKP